MYWLSTTTPTSGLCSRNHEAAWIPSSVPVGGIRMSVTTTPGDVSSMSSSSSGRSAARPTRSKSVSPSMMREMPSLRRALSSANTTLMLAMRSVR